MLARSPSGRAPFGDAPLALPLLVGGERRLMPAARSGTRRPSPVGATGSVRMGMRAAREASAFPHHRSGAPGARSDGYARAKGAGVHAP
jgi:hypothetical protein